MRLVVKMQATCETYYLYFIRYFNFALKKLMDTSLTYRLNSNIKEFQLLRTPNNRLQSDHFDRKRLTVQLTKRSHTEVTLIESLLQKIPTNTMHF